MMWYLCQTFGNLPENRMTKAHGKPIWKKDQEKKNGDILEVFQNILTSFQLIYDMSVYFEIKLVIAWSLIGRKWRSKPE
jgi:hypothetical protein